ncbi:MAG: biotin--[acetyl-CoA-carboxylase] ligase [Bacteroidia bacterium]|nr:biotin--[acetyl-CoA-carboxylase] ligase [Bacteroidia bacterium]
MQQPLNIGEYSVYIEQTTSTNDELKLLINSSNLPEGALVHTQFQSKGRGQLQNTWESEFGSNLLLSLYLKPQFLLVEEQIWLNLMISLALRDTVQEFCSQSVSIKWPNDIFIEDKKVAGILIENVLQGKRIRMSVIGIGLNLNQESFSAPNAASIKNFSGNMVDPTAARKTLCEKLNHYYALLLGNKRELLWDLYHTHLFAKGKSALFEKDGIFLEGEILGIDKKGRLHIMHGDEIKSYANKEIKLIL